MFDKPTKIQIETSRIHGITSFIPLDQLNGTIKVPCELCEKTCYLTLEEHEKYRRGEIYELLCHDCYKIISTIRAGRRKKKWK